MGTIVAIVLFLIHRGLRSEFIELVYPPRRTTISQKKEKAKAIQIEPVRKENCSDKNNPL